MKVWATYCLGTFVLTLLGSVATFFLVRQPSEVGEIFAAVLVVLTGVGVIAALLSKFVGFGDAAIPKDRRGWREGLRAITISIRGVLAVGIAYLAVILSISNYELVRNQLNAYYIIVPAKEGEVVNRRYVSSSGDPMRWERVSEDVALKYKWEWPRTYLACAAFASACCTAFFYSRAARQSPELKKKIEQGLFSPQVDESMDLNLSNVLSGKPGSNAENS
jgi:hypothetical protein